MRGEAQRADRGLIGIAVRSAVLAIALLASPARSATTFQVVLYSGDVGATPGRLAMDFITPNTNVNFAQILAFSTDGIMGQPETEGGLVSGDLILGYNPANFTYIGSSFYLNSLLVTMAPFGTLTRFAVDLTEGPPLDYPDAFSFSVLDSDNQPMILTSDPLGANALFSIQITGVPGSTLTVFDPGMMVGLDTIVVDFGDVIGVSDPGAPPRFLRFANVYPNPSAGTMQVDIDVPESVGPVSLSAFDVRGRRVATISTAATGSGRHHIAWDGRGSGGQRLAPGVYLIRIETLAGHGVARKIVLSR